MRSDVLVALAMTGLSFDHVPAHSGSINMGYQHTAKKRRARGRVAKPPRVGVAYKDRNKRGKP